MIRLEDMSIEDVALPVEDSLAIGVRKAAIGGQLDRLPHRSTGLLLGCPVQDELLALQRVEKRTSYGASVSYWVR
jgi:hypothetical protein